MASLTPIQILMLGLAGYGGYKQGAQQRADYLDEQKSRDAQQKFENEQASAKLKLIQDEADRAAAKFDAEKRAAALAQYEQMFGPMSPYLKGQQSLLAGASTPQGLFSGAEAAGMVLPPEAISGGLAALMAGPTAVGRGGVQNRFTGGISGGYNTELAPAGGGGVEQFIDPADMAKVYIPAAMKAYNQEYPPPDPLSDAPSVPRPHFWKEYLPQYMENLRPFAATRTENPNMKPSDPPPPGTDWKWIDELGAWAPVPSIPAIGAFSDQSAVVTRGR